MEMERGSIDVWFEQVGSNVEEQVIWIEEDERLG